MEGSTMGNLILIISVAVAAIVGLLCILTSTSSETEGVILHVGPDRAETVKTTSWDEHSERMRELHVAIEKERAQEERRREEKYADCYNNLATIVKDFGREVNGEFNFYVKSGLLNFNTVTKRLTYRPDGSPERVSLVDGKFETIEQLLKEIEGK